MKDDNKQIERINYTHNNLPNHIVMAQDNQNTIDYLYDAAGTKLQKVTSSDKASGLTTDYTGPFVYEDSKLAFIQTSEGRIVPDHDTYAYEYFLRDHLGNTRVMFNEQGEVLQSNSYYPFGGIMEGLNYTAGLVPENKYLFQSKELQENINIYDFEARGYDQTLGRTWQIDPHAANYYSFSPYSMFFNNPLKYIDPTGKDGWDIVKGTGLIVGGAVQWVGGVALASTPTVVGQIGGVALIMNGSGNIAWGTAVLVNNGKKDMPTGTKQAIGRKIDESTGNESGNYEKAGTVLDFVTGLPSGPVSSTLKAVDAASTVISTASTVETLSESNNRGNSNTTETNSSTTNTDNAATRDNTNVVTTPVPEIDIDNVQVDEQFLNSFIGDN